MDNVVDLLFSASLWAAALRLATPLLFGTLGELLCQRAGVINLGIEGIMTMGALVGWMTVVQTDSLWAGVVAAALVGALLGTIHSILTVLFGLSQHVVGIGLTMLGVSLSSYFFRMTSPAAGAARISPFQPMEWAVIDDSTFLGAVLQSQTALTYLVLVLVPVMVWVMYRTPLGLAVRMAGESPSAAAAQGVDVHAVRVGAVIFGSMLMGVGGAFLTLAAFDTFSIGMMNGRGWICLALVVVSSWQPGKALMAVLAFAAADAAQLRLQQMVSGLPYQLFLMVPYVLAVLVLIGLSRKSQAPQALMQSYQKGQR